MDRELLVRGFRERGFHIGQRQALLHGVAVGAGGDVAGVLVPVPNRLEPPSVRVRRIDLQSDKPMRRRRLPVRERGFAADEVRLAVVHEPIQPAHGRGVVRRVFARPNPKTLLHAQRQQGAGAEGPNAEPGAGVEQQVVHGGRMGAGKVDFIAQFPGEGQPSNQARGDADIHVARGQERHGVLAQVPRRHRPQQLAGTRAGDGDRGEIVRAVDDADIATGQVLVKPQHVELLQVARADHQEAVVG